MFSPGILSRVFCCLLLFFPPKIITFVHQPNYSGDAKNDGYFFKFNIVFWGDIRPAKICRFMGMEQDDLIQEAFLGIDKAVKMYDAAKNVKFLTYAEYHIRSRFYSAVKMIV